MAKRKSPARRLLAKQGKAFQAALKADKSLAREVLREGHVRSQLSRVNLSPNVREHAEMPSQLVSRVLNTAPIEAQGRLTFHHGPKRSERGKGKPTFQGVDAKEQLDPSELERVKRHIVTQSSRDIRSATQSAQHIRVAASEKKWGVKWNS